MLANASLDVAFHDTYYVVDEKMDIYYSLLPDATLPNGYVVYSNAQQSEGIVRTNFIKKRGVYIWTNKINGNQYIGSANDLSSRLSNYFTSGAPGSPQVPVASGLCPAQGTNSYIKYQTSRGSAISLAIFKYDLSEFSLQLIVLGESLKRDTISINSDHILLEQYYLDRYVLKYNIRRIALGPAPTLNPNYDNRKGINNTQFGKNGPGAAAWDHLHSSEQKALWSFTRSTPIFVYDSNTLRFNTIVYGYESLAKLLGVHVNTARRVAKSGNVYADKYIISLSELDKEKMESIKNNTKSNSTVVKVVHVYNKDKTVLLKTFSSVNAFIKFSKQSGYNIKLLCTTDTLWLGEYFLSYGLIDGADNRLVGQSPDNFNPVLKTRKSIPVYTYSADGTTFIKRYNSLRECVKELEGNSNTNTKSLELRIEHKQLYNGLRVSYTPLFEHEE